MFDFVIAYGKNVFTMSVNANDMNGAVDKIKRLCPNATYRPYTETYKLGDIARLAE